MIEFMLIEVMKMGARIKSFAMYPEISITGLGPWAIPVAPVDPDKTLILASFAITSFPPSGFTGVTALVTGFDSEAALRIARGGTTYPNQVFSITLLELAGIKKVHRISGTLPAGLTPSVSLGVPVDPSKCVAVLDVSSGNFGSSTTVDSAIRRMGTSVQSISADGTVLLRSGVSANREFALQIVEFL